MTVGLGILGATGKTAFAFVGQRGLRYFTDHPFLEVRAMIADDPQTYYLKPHYVAYPCVLVRLPRISRDALTDLLHAAWRFVDSSSAGRRRAGPAQRQQRSARRRRSPPRGRPPE